MTSIASQKANTTVRAPGWAVAATVILALALAILAVRELGLLAPDISLPLYWDAPGAPDLARPLV